MQQLWNFEWPIASQNSLNRLSAGDIRLQAVNLGNISSVLRQSQDRIKKKKKNPSLVFATNASIYH